MEQPKRGDHYSLIKGNKTVAVIRLITHAGGREKGVKKVQLINPLARVPKAFTIPLDDFFKQYKKEEFK